MSIYSRKFSIPLPWIITFFFAVLIIIFLAASVHFSEKGWLGNEGLIWLFAVGAVPGLVVALAQFILSWAEFGEISRLRGLGVKNILLTRDDPQYYGQLIEHSSKTIIVMGVTSKRFLQDFADDNSPRTDRKTLLAALSRGVPVKILIASEAYLDQNQKAGFQATKERCNQLKEKFPEIFDARAFDHAPTQSLVRIDNDVIVGPVFRGKESKHTPAIHMSAESQLAVSYLDNFEIEWTAAKALG